MLAYLGLAATRLLASREDGVDADERDARAGHHLLHERAVDAQHHVARHLTHRHILGVLLQLELLLVHVVRVLRHHLPAVLDALFGVTPKCSHAQVQSRFARALLLGCFQLIAARERLWQVR